MADSRDKVSAERRLPAMQRKSQERLSRMSIRIPQTGPVKLKDGETTIKKKICTFEGGIGAERKIVPKRFSSWETPRQQNYESDNFIVEKLGCRCAGSSEAGRRHLHIHIDWPGAEPIDASLLPLANHWQVSIGAEIWEGDDGRRCLIFLFEEVGHNTLKWIGEPARSPKTPKQLK